MSAEHSDRQAIREMRRELRIERDRQMRMYSRTFWEGRLGIQRRTQPRLASVSELLEGNGIAVEVDGMFGSETDTDWLTFTLTDAEPWPSDEWFDEMATKRLRTESEVEAFFVHPLLRKLGYRENDLSLQHRLLINAGSTSKRYEADLVVFDDHTDDEALLVGEAKRPGADLTMSDVNQGRSYAQWLNAPLYIVTNADTSRLYYNPPSLQPKCILEFKRTELAEKWPELVRYLSKESVIDLKEEIANRLRDLL